MSTSVEDQVLVAIDDMSTCAQTELVCQLRAKEGVLVITTTSDGVQPYLLFPLEKEGWPLSLLGGEE